MQFAARLLNPSRTPPNPELLLLASARGHSCSCYRRSSHRTSLSIDAPRVQRTNETDAAAVAAAAAAAAVAHFALQASSRIDSGQGTAASGNSRTAPISSSAHASNRLNIFQPRVSFIGPHLGGRFGYGPELKLSSPYLRMLVARDHRCRYASESSTSDSCKQHRRMINAGEGILRKWKWRWSSMHTLLLSLSLSCSCSPSLALSRSSVLLVPKPRNLSCRCLCVRHVLSWEADFQSWLASGDCDPLIPGSRPVHPFTDVALLPHGCEPSPITDHLIVPLVYPFTPTSLDITDASADDRSHVLFSVWARIYGELGFVAAIMIPRDAGNHYPDRVLALARFSQDLVLEGVPGFMEADGLCAQTETETETESGLGCGLGLDELLSLHSLSLSLQCSVPFPSMTRHLVRSSVTASFLQGIPSLPTALLD
ncbi:hypothetical protein AXG93_4193s1330 [Marchantia polymorpha subsp. ruderalis]|uniref:Uncharacterized protein n=1 Tax=Marchantia polymorpha subsp. ruderalis TaxID=1480154 RepID=A0A176W511_MARPO|nr:hypothetical protein AXG93_4193s1330 [Marchantia polymorpha subsp. ruderalis]